MVTPTTIIHLLRNADYVIPVDDERILLQLVQVFTLCPRGDFICEVEDADVWPALVGKEAITNKSEFVNCSSCMQISVTP